MAMTEHKILMCPPDFFTVEYVINPWMAGHEASLSLEVAHAGDLEKGLNDKGWLLHGKSYNTLLECKEAFYGDYAAAEAAKLDIIQRELAKVYGADFNQTDKTVGEV